MSQTNIFLSEVFSVFLTNPNRSCFRLYPEVNRKVGNRFSWRFSQQFPHVIVIWLNGYFWILAKPGEILPTPSQWQEAISSIQEGLRDDIGNLNYTYQDGGELNVNPNAEAQLASRILKMSFTFSAPRSFSKNKVEVKREIEFWPDTIQINNITVPALTLTIKSNFYYQGDLAQFYNDRPQRYEPEKLLIGLRVKDIASKSSAKITGLSGTIGDRREELLQKATGRLSRQKLREAPDEQPIVSVRFGKSSRPFDYAMGALLPCVTEDTAERFQVNYGELLIATKVPYSERQTLLQRSREQAARTLAEYGFELRKNINSKSYEQLFLVPELNLEETQILFGNNLSLKKKKLLSGLSQGGVYRRHEDFQDRDRPIRIGIFRVCDRPVQRFYNELKQRLNRYHFQVVLPQENIKKVSVRGLSGPEARAKTEEALEDLMNLSVDLVIVFLPEHGLDDETPDEGSLYMWLYSRLVRRQIPTQIMREDTLNNPNDYPFIINQVALGILTKLGNLLFILAEPLEIADCFLGFDISRQPNQRSPGSRNACASVRIYDKQGAFIRYCTDDAIVEGEEIPQQVIETFLPRADLQNKTVLIYRDGLFRGREIDRLLTRAKAINAKFILVECRKSNVPRLYSFGSSRSTDFSKKLMAPPRGLALKLSDREVILVTTKLHSEKIGVPRPLRLKICARGEQVSVESLVETTLKLTLLHHGALQEPRLPIPLYGSDRIAKLRLQGIYPGSPDGDRQFWL
ncbi:Piwi domain-containing protein [Roseofilum casamattae]|uniref:Protein argonaute n=1 Tax=Roseofilum casamattae BLCC-M143 TaxID=3022442 RepID=A0ABT7BYL9_9CYAN|nr:Piwi domain-containing protein [Roseofilum casamattae]MDJ1183546.1 Piwi domain-containing protein [Roseofilum casamattae BLCC-M143]